MVRFFIQGKVYENLFNYHDNDYRIWGIFIWESYRPQAV